MKPGLKTTEFWGKTALQAYSLFQAYKGHIDPNKAAVITSILEGVYIVVRGLVKFKGQGLPEIPKPQ